LLAIPGLAGLGCRPDGKQNCLLAADDEIRTMADKALVDRCPTIELPSGALRSASRNERVRKQVAS
jgi:hypothetical protein